MEKALSQEQVLHERHANKLHLIQISVIARFFSKLCTAILYFFTQAFARTSSVTLLKNVMQSGFFFDVLRYADGDI
jgi:hypothetical protein